MSCPGCLEGCETTVFVRLAEQPVTTEATIDGVFVKTLVLPLSGTVVPQHAHATAHTTVVVKGGVRAWRNGKIDRDHWAPCGIVIPAETMHTFQTLADDTRLMCVHDLSGGGDVDVVGYNSLPGAD